MLSVCLVLKSAEQIDLRSVTEREKIIVFSSWAHEIYGLTQSDAASLSSELQ